MLTSSVMTSSLTLVLLFLISSAHAKDGTSLADKLYLRFLPPNEAAMAITPPEIITAETPIVIRYTLIIGIAVYEARAACHPKALSFFGTKDRVPRWFCSADNEAILFSYTTYVAISLEYPLAAATYANFLRKNGLEPASKSRNTTTLNGWANVIGNRLSKYFARDGWNSLGDLSRDHFRLPFEDYTNYQPVNDPYIRRPKKPLRWQPLSFTIDRLGRFAHQIHVTPQIGTKVEPLAISSKDMNRRVTRSPYHNPKRLKKLNPKDNRFVQAQLDDLLRISTKLTPMQRFLARWWDNKLFATAAMSAFYEFENRLTPFEAAQQFMGEMIAQHDALVTVWREKRRHDLARPRSLLKFLRPGQTVKTFISEKKGVGRVFVEDWKGLLNDQPHSEFPSGSAALCFASSEHLQEYHKRVKGRVPPFKVLFPKGTYPFSFRDTTVIYANPMEAARSCAESRLWGGVHFRPAVQAGMNIGRGIGKIALEHVLTLGRGKVPSKCNRCFGESPGESSMVV